MTAAVDARASAAQSPARTGTRGATHFIELSASDAARAQALAARLREHPQVKRVLPEDRALSLSDIPKALWAQPAAAR